LAALAGLENAGGDDLIAQAVFVMDDDLVEVEDVAVDVLEVDAFHDLPAAEALGDDAVVDEVAGASVGLDDLDIDDADEGGLGGAGADIVVRAGGDLAEGGAA